jgi:hypothetical protein
MILVVIARRAPLETLKRHPEALLLHLFPARRHVSAPLPISRS